MALGPPALLDIEQGPPPYERPAPHTALTLPKPRALAPTPPSPSIAQAEQFDLLLGDPLSGPGLVLRTEPPGYRVLALTGFDPYRADRQSLPNTLHTFPQPSSREAPLARIEGRSVPLRSTKARPDPRKPATQHVTKPVLGMERGRKFNYNQLVDADSTRTRGKRAPTTNEMTRVLGVSLAVNGVTEGKALEQPGKLPRTIAFSNTILRSKWYAKALMESEVLRATTRRMADGRAMKVAATHLDASASALQRNQELRALGEADGGSECRILCNVKLFTEGVDVPSLDAVAFRDPRDRQVDVVQAVGRVMRKAPGKRFGYIIVPVVVEPGGDVAAALTAV